MSEPAVKRVKAENGSSRPSSVTNDGEAVVDDVNIVKVSPLLPPACLIEELPVSAGLAQTIRATRKRVQASVGGQSDKLIVVVGPCSIHDVEQGLEYARLLAGIQEEFREDLVLIMRVYFEKPRTTVGWKGLINDPELNGTFQINKGLKLARKLLIEINEMGIGCAVEFLDTISPQYIADLISWGAIGARTTESQVHRELASGLSCPIGFKNGTGGSIQIAVDAVKASKRGHRFLSVTKQGLSAIVHTRGNPYSHLILRGGKDGPNYDAKSVAEAQACMAKGGVSEALVIDCSHANSMKDHKNQPIVAAEIAKQLEAGNSNIVGVMIESHVHEGKQTLDPGVTNVAELKHGVSVTDACINWTTTVETLKILAAAVKARRRANVGVSIL